MDMEKKTIDSLKHLLTIAKDDLELHTRTCICLGLFSGFFLGFFCFGFFFGRCFPLTNYADETMQLFMLYLHAQHSIIIKME